MTSPEAALSDLWRLGGGDPAALGQVVLTGADPQLPSSFAVGTAAQATIAAAGLAAAEMHRQRTGDHAVGCGWRCGMRRSSSAASGTFASSVRNRRKRGIRSPVVYEAAAGRFVRLHTNFAASPARRSSTCSTAPMFAAACRRRCCGGRRRHLRRPPTRLVASWRPCGPRNSGPRIRKGQAIAGLPPLQITKIGEAPLRPLPPSERPLSGIRVLDLSRVIAGPVAGRTLAAHGADVLLIASPNLPSIPWLVIDTGRGKRSAHIDLATTAGKAKLTELLAEADIFSQGYRPHSIANLGFSPEDAARIRPGIVYVSLSAYGPVGPWADRRGFDSLVQTATGINHAEAEALGDDYPKELPAQALDHASGYLMAFGAMMARARQAREGGSWHVQVSLAQTGQWLTSPGRERKGFQCADPALADVADLLEEDDSGFGRLRAVSHSAYLSKTAAYWELPSVPLGTHAPEWA